ncbi:MAG: M28 family peptidase [Spirochaetales bacterium]
MLTTTEKEILHTINREGLEQHLRVIESYCRLSGTAEELKAFYYLQEELEKVCLRSELRFYSALLSNPGKVHFTVFSPKQTQEKLNANFSQLIPAKAKSFSAPTPPMGLRGSLCLIRSAELEIDPLLYSMSKRAPIKDLENCLVLSEVLNPIQVLALQDRGALASIQYWDGQELQIHEGICDPIWGMPEPEELPYYPTIPVISINGKDGGILRKKLESGESILGEITVSVETGIQKIPILEAWIPSSTGDPKFLLIGSHLDSWYQGATDNATGNALALILAQTLSKMEKKLPYGIRFAWWSGHSNGRYAGSSLYARERYRELSEFCLAYMNIDMPGLRGATEYSRLATGLELIPLASEVVEDLTGQKGNYFRPPRGWDQSFQNIGITPYFVWSSTLADGHPDSTGNSFMSWWWHTEEDRLPYYSKAVLEKDTEVYLLAALRFLQHPYLVFKPLLLAEGIKKELRKLNSQCPKDFTLLSSLEILEELTTPYTQLEQQGKLTLKELLFILRSLNRLYYTRKPSYAQDWAIERGALPGFAIASRLSGIQDSIKLEVLLHDLHCQQNRIIQEMLPLLEYMKLKLLFP